METIRQIIQFLISIIHSVHDTNRHVLILIFLISFILSSQSAICLIRLLILQAKHVRDNPPLERLDAVYIQEVILEKNKLSIEDRVMNDIVTVRNLACFYSSLFLFLFVRLFCYC